MDATTSGDDVSSGGTAGRKRPASRTSATGPNPEGEKLNRQLEEAENLVSQLQDLLLDAQSREEGYRSRVEHLEAVIEGEKQRYQSLMREVILTSAIDGLSTSLQRIDITLGSRFAELGTQLAPLSALTTLTSAGAEVGADVVERFAAVQGATARISSDYVVQRADILQPGLPATTSVSAASTSASAT